jgi:hypothetical protein
MPGDVVFRQAVLRGQARRGAAVSSKYSSVFSAQSKRKKRFNIY